ncbi:MAG TPA: glutamine-hydrolyzing GMP synthase [bacterium]|nr:glutamine-hydrolyzing GMP synthase [bacterium]HQL60711.1 glutamine-hydrolyzing GMP synthase [bacterium]
MPSIGYDKILVLDFGSQYSHLIARRIRELRVYCELHPCTMSMERICSFAPKGIILSGGPASVYEQGAPTVDPGIWDLGVPILGICYGFQLMMHQLGGEVARGTRREYGHAQLEIERSDPLFAGLGPNSTVWMSHGDKVYRIPHTFRRLAVTHNSEYAAIVDPERHLYGIQFHPEVTHTPDGMQILDNFVSLICRCNHNWTMGSFVEEAVRRIRDRVGEGKVIGAVSGGVDSTVAAVLVSRAIDDRFTAIFVDHGLLRLNEAEQVVSRLRNRLGIRLVAVDASERFLSRLQGITEPEQKRKIIGNVFIEVFEEEARKLGEVDFLMQGTLYPDVIESTPFRGPSAKIKSHHNVEGLPERMNLKLIEPLRELFKDEVRAVGKELGLDDDLIYRQPFPGPGLGVRCLGHLTRERLDILRHADAIYIDEIRKAGLYREIGQAFAVLLPVRSVGVMGDDRTYEEVIALRAVHTRDYMTADWVPLPYELLRIVSNRIINEVRGVNRVVYDISSKPPSTIEWE